MKYLKTYESNNQKLDNYEQYGKDVLQISKKLGSQFLNKGYRWEKGLSGTPIDIKSSNGETIFAKTPDGSSYCTGFSFAVFIISLWNRRNKLDKNLIRKLQKEWNQGKPEEKPKLCVNAIVSNNLGKEVTLEEANPGDFVQLWRQKGSGHSAILVEKIKKGDKIIGIKYYTSNSSTKGPGEGQEKFTDSGGSVIRDNTYFARIK
jgi:hypothetical protein